MDFSVLTEKLLGVIYVCQTFNNIYKKILEKLLSLNYQNNVFSVGSSEI